MIYEFYISCFPTDKEAIQFPNSNKAVKKMSIDEIIKLYNEWILEKRTSSEWQLIAEYALSGDDNLVYNAWCKYHLSDSLKQLQSLRAVLLQCEGKPGINTLNEVIDQLDKVCNPPKI